MSEFSKLCAEEKVIRKDLKRKLRDYGRGQLFSFPNEGVTVLCCPANTMPDSRMVHVATAFCDFDEDTWNRKRGELTALEHWNAGMIIAVPRNDRDLATIAEDVVALMFSGGFVPVGAMQFSRNVDDFSLAPEAAF